jgi:hypothetical protein
MFANKARSLPKGGASERCFTWSGSGLTHKYWTKLERLGRDNALAYCEKFELLKSFITLAPDRMFFFSKPKAN